MLDKNTSRPQFKRLLLFSPSLYSETNSDSSDEASETRRKEQTERSLQLTSERPDICVQRELKTRPAGKQETLFSIAPYSFGYSSEGEGPSDKASPSKLLSILFFLIVFYRPFVSYGAVFKLSFLLCNISTVMNAEEARENLPSHCNLNV